MEQLYFNKCETASSISKILDYTPQVANLRAVKAQLFSFDLLISVSLALLMISFVVMYWNISSEEISRGAEQRELQSAAFDASNYIMKVFLVNSPNVFDRSKLLSFAQCNYTQNRQELGLEGFEFYFALIYPNGSIVALDNSTIACGADYSNSSNLFAAKRTGSFENQRVTMNLYVWK